MKVKEDFLGQFALDQHWRTHWKEVRLCVKMTYFFILFYFIFMKTECHFGL